MHGNMHGSCPLDTLTCITDLIQPGKYRVLAAKRVLAEEEVEHRMLVVPVRLPAIPDNMEYETQPKAAETFFLFD